MKKVTHTQLLCWAINHLNNEAHAEMERQEKAKETAATDIVEMLQKSIDDYIETMETIKTMYEIETGTKF